MLGELLFASIGREDPADQAVSIGTCKLIRAREIRNS